MINRDFVDLSVGRFYLKPLRNGVLKRAYIVGTIAGGVLNNAKFLYFLERKDEDKIGYDEQIACIVVAHNPLAAHTPTNPL